MSLEGIVRLWNSTTRVIIYTYCMATAFCPPCSLPLISTGDFMPPNFGGRKLALNWLNSRPYLMVGDFLFLSFAQAQLS